MSLSGGNGGGTVNLAYCPAKTRSNSVLPMTSETTPTILRDLFRLPRVVLWANHSVSGAVIITRQVRAEKPVKSSRSLLFAVRVLFRYLERVPDIDHGHSSFSSLWTAA